MPFEDPAVLAFRHHQAAFGDMRLSRAERDEHFAAMGEAFKNIGKARVEKPALPPDSVGTISEHRLKHKYGIDPEEFKHSEPRPASERRYASSNSSSDDELEHYDKVTESISKHKLRRFDRKIRMSKALNRASATVFPKLKGRVSALNSSLDEHRDQIIAGYRRTHPGAILTGHRQLPNPNGSVLA